jgi:HprK-related kinase A
MHGRVGDLSAAEMARALRRGPFRYQVGPFRVDLRSRLPDVAETFHRLYTHLPLAPAEGLADFHVRIEPGGGVRRWFRSQVRFSVDGQYPFEPFPAYQAFALLEWGLNLCVAVRAQQYLMLHSAALEKDGAGLLLPAWPASGKSTLCAALVSRGWRLLSDEFGLVVPLTDRLVAMPRCIPLKNQSIEVIRRFAPEAVIGPVFPHTRKGDVAHVAPPRESVDRAGDTAPARFVVFPKYGLAEGAVLKTLPKARAFLKLAGNSFNYEVMGVTGFRTVAEVIRSSRCYLFHYSDLPTAVAMLDDLVRGAPVALAGSSA